MRRPARDSPSGNLRGPRSLTRTHSRAVSRLRMTNCKHEEKAMHEILPTEHVAREGFGRRSLLRAVGAFAATAAIGLPGRGPFAQPSGPDPKPAVPSNI